MIFMINTLSEINKAAAENTREFINKCEENYHSVLLQIAQHIRDNRHLKIIMLAGPSGSGKTTSALLLCRYLKELNIYAQTVSLDNFYLDAEFSPLLHDGTVDTESVYALDLKEIQHCFSALLKNGKCSMPVFDFASHKSIKNAQTADITGGGVLIVEGLHALNPEITDHLPKDSLYKIYVSVNDSVFDDSGNEILSSRKIRLMRRVLRDEKFRGSSIEKTLYMWTQVVSGEEKYLYCFKDEADVQLSTFHPYEVCVYNKHFNQMLTGLNPQTENYEYACLTGKGVEPFLNIPFSAVPEISLIREFIGNDDI